MPNSAITSAQLASRAAHQHRLGNLSEAEELYRRILVESPDDFTALHMLGMILHQRGEHSLALVMLDRASNVPASGPDFHSNRALVLAASGEFGEAEKSCARALALAPDFVPALYNRANALLGMQRFEDALVAYDRVISLASDHAKAFNNRGNTLRSLDRHEEALSSHMRSAQINPSDPKNLSNIASLLYDLSRFSEAANFYRKLLAIDPNFDYARGGLFAAQMQICDWSNYEYGISDIRSRVNAKQRAIAPFFFLSVTDSPSEQLTCARSFLADRYRPSAESLWCGARYSHSRIRLAYVSSDFHDHATTSLIAGLFERHDRDRFEVFAVSYGRASRDPMRLRIEQAVEHFIDVHAKPSREIAEMLREMEIDIAVDLKGFTAGGRLDVFAHRPAPVQISYLGYPGTTGAPYIDYILADQYVVPPAHDDCYSERVIRLPGCYQVNDDQREINRALTRSDCGIPEDAFVFCCLNGNYKLTPVLFDIWMRLLVQVPGSTLWLMAGPGEVVPNLRGEARRRGVDPGRLVFAEFIEPARHRGRYALADLFLDTLPICGHTTVSDALWAGLPVLTCASGAFAGRVAGSLLQAMGLSELVTSNLSDYERKAVELAKQPTVLQALRDRLRANQLSRPLFDTGLFCRNLEATYQELGADRRRNLKHLDDLK